VVIDSTPTAAAAPAKGSSSNPSYDVILGAARDLFVEHGFPNVPMDTIARRASVSRATVYNNFRDKEAILVAILDRYQQGYAAIPERVRDMAGQDRSSFELIEEMIREAFEWRLANRQLRPLINLAKSLPANEAWTASGAAADEVIQRWLLTIHRRDAKRGMVRDGLRLTSATAALWGMIDAALPRADALTSPAAVRTTARELALLHWYAIYKVGPVRTTARGNAGRHPRAKRASSAAVPGKAR
jgi:AcrR family transcriptional regulator